MKTYKSRSHEMALSALADPTRRAVFERVAEAPAAVVEVAARLPVSRPAVSQHLRVLKNAGLVVDRREGNRRLYAANPDALAELRDYVERFWTKALAGFKDTAERCTRGERA